MKTLAAIFSLFACVSLGGELSLKGGLVLENAVIKGVSGQSVMIVGHSGGVGMYSFSQLTPYSAAVVSNLLSGATVSWPVAIPSDLPPVALQVQASGSMQVGRVPGECRADGKARDSHERRAGKTTDRLWLASIRTSWGQLP